MLLVGPGRNRPGPRMADPSLIVYATSAFSQGVTLHAKLIQLTP